MTAKLEGLKIANDIANKKSGKCVSSEYINCYSKLLWECQYGHRWLATLSNIKKSRWCPECAKKTRAQKLKLSGLDLAKEISEKRQGKCLSDKYVRIEEKMIWECKIGHQWESSLACVRNQGTWCPYCARNRVDNGLEAAYKVSQERSGRCLSTTYKNMHTKMFWECKNRHKWWANLDKISAGGWCPKCAIAENGKKRRLDGLVIANNIAEKMGGKCLSTKYKGISKKLKWKCKNGHTWLSVLSNIKNNGAWCPVCAQTTRSLSQRNTYILKHWKTGVKLVCQGSWEKKVIQYLNKNKINYRWKPRFFVMPSGKKYYPDMYLTSTRKWIEIKGYFWEDAKEKWEWFHKEHLNSELWNKEVLQKMKVIK